MLIESYNEKAFSINSQFYIIILIFTGYFNKNISKKNKLNDFSN